MWHWFKSLFAGSMLFEVTGVVRSDGFRIRYWHGVRVADFTSETEIHAKVVRECAALLERSVRSKDSIAWSLVEKLKLNAVEVVADNDKASGVVLYRNWP